ncbi:MAG: hypothetical protein EOP47_03880 [Sphingobacteriaceae bacterium]|nr:MAG: hypothetical protein EOP47_03880 [Sphingobacteriaceae bacterium]
MKRILLILLVSIGCFQWSSAQNQKSKMVGVWQVGTSQLADAWLANYRFFKDGTFKYTFSQYDDRGRILSAVGNYKLKGDTLYLIVKARKERVGGDLVGGSAGFQQEELVLDGDKLINIKQKVIRPLPFLIKWINKKGIKGFEIQNNTYYLVSTDPHKDEE